ncbi:unnamed protein product, partial [Mycena citricolor]
RRFELSNPFVLERRRNSTWKCFFQIGRVSILRQRDEDESLSIPSALLSFQKGTSPVQPLALLIFRPHLICSQLTI